MPQYDAEVVVGAKVDPQGFAEGVEKMTEEANDPLEAFKKEMQGKFDEMGAQLAAMGPEAAAGVSAIGVALGVVVGIIAAVVLGFVAIVSVVITIVKAIISLTMATLQWGKSMIDQMNASMQHTSGLWRETKKVQDLFESVRQASYAAFAPLLEFALPYIQMVVNWLVKLFNLLGMILAKLLGQSKAWQYVAGSTNKATDAANDALAAWDELNVLNQGGGANAGAGQFVQMDVDPDIIKNTFQGIIDWLLGLWTGFTDWLHERWLFVVAWFTQIWSGIVNFFMGIWTSIMTFLGPIIASIGQWFSGLWASISEWAKNAWERISAFWGPVVEWFGQLIANVLAYWRSGWALIWANVHNVYALILNLIGAFAMWVYTNIIKPVSDRWAIFWNALLGIANIAWSGILDTALWLWNQLQLWLIVPLATAFSKVWDGLVTGLKTVLNAVIRLLNSGLSKIAGFLNSLSDLANRTFGAMPGWTIIPHVTPLVIPELAQGAVIPPNARFMAMLGDQRNGRNIEAPEDLIRKIVREETEGLVGGTTNIRFTGPMSALIRAMKPVIESETRRAGTSLIVGEGA